MTMQKNNLQNYFSINMIINTNKIELGTEFCVKIKTYFLTFGLKHLQNDFHISFQLIYD